MAERAHPEQKSFTKRRFGVLPNPFARMLKIRYRFCNPYIKNKRVLDIPTGTGWGTKFLCGYSQLTGLDIDAGAVEYAQKRYGGANKSFTQGDMANLPVPDNSVDVVLCLEGFEHVPKETGLKFLQEARRVLVKDGLLLLTCPVLNAYGKSSGNPYHLYEYPEQELFEVINNNFSILSAQRFTMPDGPAYRFVLKNFKQARYLEP